jgi:hypothetical protein
LPVLNSCSVSITTGDSRFVVEATRGVPNGAYDTILVPTDGGADPNRTVTHAPEQCDPELNATSAADTDRTQFSTSAKSSSSR